MSSLEEKLNKAFKRSEDSGEKNYKGINNDKDDDLDSIMQTENIQKEVPKITFEEPKRVEESRRMTLAEKYPYTPETTSKVETYNTNNNYSTDKDLIKKIVRIVNLYNNLTTKIRQNLTIFLALKVDTIEEVVSSIITLEEEKILALDDLIKLREEEAVSRAFTLMDLGNGRLRTLSNLTIFFNGNTYKETTTLDNKIEFCRGLEKGIGTLPLEALDSLKPILEILKASR